MDNFMIAFVVLLITNFGARIINEKATKKLDQDKKAALIDVFSGDRVWTYGILIVLVVLFFSTLRFNWIDPLWTYLLYVACIIGYTVVMGYNSHKKLKANGFPDFYIRSYIISTSFRIAGIVVFFALMEF